MSALYQKTVPSPIGDITLIAGETALVEVLLSGTPIRTSAVAGSNAILERAERELSEYFRGERQEFTTPLAPEGTEFQVAAWKALSRIPYGETRSYAEQAALIGRPKAVRAIGAANGRNPLPIFLPCHRVIGSDGSLTGYGGGLDKKEWLLAHEKGKPG
ncbi:MAG: methylated-DNA--[protein]-cysteine S-methyltransferase [Acidobacteria bacterium]|nr:methylated-DNA--[protein]-cysteine S-methyltransferase [Acidobacteriota bacterium]